MATGKDNDKMSDENTTATEGKKAREPKKNSIPSADVKELVAGIPQYEKASFLVVGYKDGVRLALPLTNGVSRTYFYGNGNYSIIPEDEAIRVFSAEERKENRLGGLMAEVDYSQGLDAARRALTKLVEVVRAAPVPQPKPKREPKKPKAAAPAEAAETSAESDPASFEGADSDESVGDQA
jgi:hypothetical protein